MSDSNNINTNKIDTDTSELSDNEDTNMSNAPNLNSIDENNNDDNDIIEYPQQNTVLFFTSKETPLSKMMKSVNNREEEQIISKLKLQMEQKEITKVYAVHTIINYKKLLGSHERTFEKLDTFMNEIDPKSDIRNGTYKDKLLYKQYAIYALIGYIIACIIRYYILKLTGYD